MLKPDIKQQKALDYFKNFEILRFYLGFEMGLGKTYTALWNFYQHKISNFIVVCDKKTLNQWKSSILNLDEYKEYKIDIIDTPKQVAWLLNNKCLTDKKTIYITTYHRAVKFLNSYYDFQNTHKKEQLPLLNLILDESQILKDAKSLISKTFKKLNSYFHSLQLLSGSVISNNMTNLYTQSILLDYEPNKKDISYSAYANKYFLIAPSRYSHFSIIGHKPELEQELLKPFKDKGVFYRNDFEDISINYINLFSDKLFKLDTNLIKHKVWIDDNSIKLLDTPLNTALVYRMLNSGFIYANKLPDDYISKLDNFFNDNPTGKVDSFLELIDNDTRITKYFYSPKHLLLEKQFATKQNFVIFHSFTAEIKDIERVAKKYNYNVYKINGESNELIDAINDTSLKIVIIQYEAGSKGIDGLQHSFNNLIHYSLTYSYEKYSQANARIFRKLQTKNVNIFHYLTSQMDYDILNRLQKGKDYNNLIFAKTYKKL